MNIKHSTLSVRSLSVSAGGREILKPAFTSFEALSGEIVGLLGPNGSGKSTLLKSICGLMKKNSGAVAYNNRETDIMSRKECARTFGYMSQSEAFTSAYTVIESVVMGRYPHLRGFANYSREDYDIARDSLRRVELEGFESRFVTELSGGESARVIIARALAQQTPVILLDEPTAALDPRHSHILMKLMRELASEGRIVLIAIHDINLALNGVDRMLFLKNGAIVSDSDTSLVDAHLLELVYDIPWKISEADESGRIFAIPQD